MATYDPRFLPICKEDLDALGWDYVDVIIVSADAYVDHPCFGHAVVGRLFEHEGLRVVNRTATGIATITPPAQNMV